jgi:LemA protein
MVTDARAKAGGVLNISEEVLNDPESFRKFQEAQGELSHVLQRMMVVVEQNPAIKADQNFLALQAQLEGSENRIAVERKRFNEAVQQYNAYIKKFPQAMISGIFDFEEKTYFKADQGAEKAPTVNFN